MNINLQWLSSSGATGECALRFVWASSSRHSSTEVVPLSLSTYPVVNYFRRVDSQAIGIRWCGLKDHFMNNFSIEIELHQPLLATILQALIMIHQRWSAIIRITLMIHIQHVNLVVLCQFNWIAGLIDGVMLPLIMAPYLICCVQRIKVASFSMFVLPLTMLKPWDITVVKLQNNGIGG